MRVRRMVLYGSIMLAACSARSGNAAHFARGIGLGTAPQIEDKVQRVLALHQFEIEEQQPAPNMYVETRWRDRTPTQDEQAAAVDAVQARVIVRTRPRSSTSQLGDVYTVDVAVEQRVRGLGSQEWIYRTVTQGAREFANRIVEDLRRELNVGIRAF